MCKLLEAQGGSGAVSDGEDERNVSMALIALSAWHSSRGTGARGKSGKIEPMQGENDMHLYRSQITIQLPCSQRYYMHNSH